MKQLLELCILRVILCKFSIALTAEPGSDRHLGIRLRADNDQILMCHDLCIRRLEFIISGSLHDPRIILTVIRNNSGTLYSISCINPYRLLIFIQYHLLECMQIAGDGILICIPAIIQPVKVVQLRLLHHRKLCIQKLICNTGDCHRNFLCHGHTLARKCHDEVSGKAFFTETVYICTVSTDCNRRIIGSYSNLFILKYILVLIILDLGVSWKLQVVLAVCKICSRACINILDALCRIILVKDCQQFILCRDHLRLCFYQYLEFFCDGAKVSSLFYHLIQYCLICRKCRSQRHLCIFDRTCHCAGRRINRRIYGRLLNLNDTGIGTCPCNH